MSRAVDVTRKFKFVHFDSSYQLFSSVAQVVMLSLAQVVMCSIKNTKAIGHLYHPIHVHGSRLNASLSKEQTNLRRHQTKLPPEKAETQINYINYCMHVFVILVFLSLTYFFFLVRSWPKRRLTNPSRHQSIRA